MIITNRLDPTSKDYFGPREDLSFIVRFNWKSSSHLKEAIKVLLAARLDTDETEEKEEREKPKRSEILDDNEFLQIRKIIASNPNTPPAVLSYLAKVSGQDILERIAENPRTPLHSLERLAHCPYPSVRSAVAENPNASPDILTILGNDPDADVRYHLAENPHLPEELLIGLSEDPNPYVSHRAAATLARIEGGMVVTGLFLRTAGDERDTAVL